MKEKKGFIASTLLSLQGHPKIKKDIHAKEKKFHDKFVKKILLSILCIAVQLPGF